jgi:hypothetical protein
MSGRSRELVVVDQEASLANATDLERGKEAEAEREAVSVVETEVEVTAGASADETKKNDDDITPDHDRAPKSRQRDATAATSTNILSTTKAIDTRTATARSAMRPDRRKAEATESAKRRFTTTSEFRSKL